MSMQSTEKPVPEHDASHVPQQPQPTPTSALTGAEPQLRRPVVGGLAFGQEATSSDILTELATPKIFAGPEVELQQRIVARLEDGVIELDKTAEKVNETERAKVEQANGTVLAALKARQEDLDYEKSRYSWSPLRKSPEELAAIEKALDDDRGAAGRLWSRQVKAVPTKKYDRDILYIGSIVLTDIPAKADGDAEMIKKAELVQTDYALGNADNGAALPKAAKVDKDIVVNTLKTMIAAGQIEYLRRSGIVGPAWQVIVEIHYYRSRSKTQANLHKDTLGQTLFVNLNYTNEVDWPGPEYVVNPPTVPTHEERIRKTLPDAFNRDLASVRTASEPASRIENSRLPPHGVVAFVDESIHHATPLLGHRRISAEKVREWVAGDQEFLAGTGADARVGKAVLEACETAGKATEETDRVLTRPDLKKAGMSDDDIDRMLSAVGPNEWNAVSIPSAARADKEITREPIRPAKDDPSAADKPKTRLKRAMSYEDLSAFPKDDPTAPRRFFRTWVRAVRKG